MTRIQAARVMHNPIELIVEVALVNLASKIFAGGLKPDFLLNLDGCALLSNSISGLFEPKQLYDEVFRKL